MCPFGFVQRVPFGCEGSADRSCPETPNVTRLCVCDVCVPACPDHAELQQDGKCHCQDGALEIGGKCAPTNEVLVETLVPGLAVLVGIFLFGMGVQKRQADRAWQIEPKMIQVDEPPEVLGTGAFGVVLAARFRGHKVALKRAFAGKAKRSTRSTRSRNAASNSSPKRGLFNSGQRELQRNTSVNASVRNTGAKSVADSNRIAQAFAVAEEGFIPPNGNTCRQSLSFLSGHRSTTLAAFVDKLFWIFKPSKLAQARKQLIREMRILSRLQHPNICQMIGVVMNNSEPLMVLEYLQMGSLHGILHNQAMDLDGDFIFSTLRDIVAGVRFLHASGLIHGDLKSAVWPAV